MRKLFTTSTLVIILVSLILTACERPASIAPVTVAIPTRVEPPFTVPTTQPTIPVQDTLTIIENAPTPTLTLRAATIKTIVTATPIPQRVLPTSGAPVYTTPSGVPVVLPNTTPVPPNNPTVLPIPITVMPNNPTGLPNPTMVLPNPTMPLPTAILPTPVPTFVSGRPSEWILQKDEFLFCLARRYDVDPAALMALNGVDVNSARLLTPGTRILIPASGNWPPSLGARPLIPHPATYTVAGDDSIYQIACDYGDVDPAAIAAANGLSAPYILTPGQKLQIP